MPHQVASLLLPIQMPLELLPLGLFTESHGHDLAAFLNVIQLAARDMGRPDVSKAATSAGMVLLAMRDRVKAGKTWNVTVAERETLMREITVCDHFMRRLPAAQIRKSINQTLAWCDKAMAMGKEEMDVFDADGFGPIERLGGVAA